MPSFISNQGLVLLRIILGRDSTVAQIADDVQISEQATHAIVRELVKERFITSQKVGRRNVYRGMWLEGFEHKPLPGRDLTLRDVVTALAALAGMMAATRARVLLFVAERPESTMSQIAAARAIPETDVLSALHELEKDKLVSRQRKGGTATYIVHPRARSDQNRPINVVEEIRLARLAKVEIPDPLDTLDRILGPVT